MIPSQVNAAFVCALEDVLDVYTRPYDPTHPVGCLDETTKPLVAETRTPLPSEPGPPARVDYEYERHGTATLFMSFEPTTGHRQVEVTERRTAVDFAKVVRAILDVWYPHAERVVLVLDHRNIHTPAALYEAFEPAVARRLIEPLELHHTPQQGSGLNRAELELSALSRQCLDRRLPDIATLTREVTAWEQTRNAITRPVDWRFTTPDARIKLKRLYPSIQTG